MQLHSNIVHDTQYHAMCSGLIKIRLRYALQPIAQVDLLILRSPLVFVVQYRPT